MKKHTFFCLLILAVCIITAIVFVYYKPTKQPVVNQIEAPVVSEGIIVANSFQTKVLNPSDVYMKFDVKYPYFKNADKDFNLMIENLLKDKIEESKKISEENWQSRYDTQVKGDNIPKTPASDDKFSFYSDFKVVQSNSDYISCVLTYGGFTGGAHGYEENMSFNYDLKNQKNVTLKDLFTDDSNYLDYVSEKSRESLKKTFATVSEDDRKYATEKELKVIVDDIMASIESGTEPKEENFSIFTFTKDKVKIYFAQYQVGPYTLGSPEVEIHIK